MQNFWWICWFVWESLPTLTAHPVSAPNSSDTNDTLEYQSCWPCDWEQYWLRYTIGLLGVTVTAFTLVGCLCCRRHRRPKGFQAGGGKREQEFKDGSTTGRETTFENALGSLELGVPRNVALVDRVQFEPLPVDRFVPDAKIIAKPKRPPPSPSLLSEEHEQNQFTLQKSCHEWFDAADRHLPRERLKYLREIGRGWFGKVVEGRADFDNSNGTSKNDGVVVRILTEEATIKEKAWFLGEATPYLKLHHRNILALLGFCLETDPYLLLFESCPSGDLKGFLRSNRDQRSQKALARENIPLRMAVEIAVGLEHMHVNGFAHTDLSARNCLVASDLSAKLGDYGTGVEKYPDDYYVVGDRALPIRWSAPESLECTESTIETREITPEANIWSYAVLLWEIATWGDRPYDDLGDEQVIEMLVSLKLGFDWAGSQLLLRHLEDCSLNLCDAMRLCWNLDPGKRSTLEEVRRILFKERTGTEDFEQRWKNLRPNVSKGQVRSASLQDLRGSVDSDCWPSIVEEKSTVPPTSFRLGPGEPVKNIPGSKNSVVPLQESGSETEEESWRGRVERGAYTEKVRQKSKSVADLMVLVHIDSDSDAEWSMGAQTSEKTIKKRFPATSSDSDLRSAVLADEFDETLRKLRDPLQSNSLRGVKFPHVPDRPKLLTLTTDQEQTPILRLSFETKEPDITQNDHSHTTNTNDTERIEEHVLRLLSKGDPNLPLLRYVPDRASYTDKSQGTHESQTVDSFLTLEEEIPPCFSNNFSIGNLEDNRQTELVNVALWNHALDTALEQKIPGFMAEGDFKEEIESHLPKRTEETTPELVVTTASAPDTPHSQGNSSIGNGEDDFSNIDELEVERKALPNETEEEDDCKRLSTPDDERSSDSGFRDKESCEEEEGPLPCPPHPPPPLPSPTLLLSNPLVSPSISVPILAEEEQLRILSELDAILDAEYCEALDDSVKLAEDISFGRAEMIVANLEESVCDSDQNVSPSELEQPRCFDSDTLVKKEENRMEECKENAKELEESGSKNEEKCKENEERTAVYDHEESTVEKISFDTKVNPLPDCDDSISKNVHQTDDAVASSCELQRLDNECVVPQIDNHRSVQENENNNEIEDEDSSTVSLRSDNSYVSFGMEEEFVAAIRNELREKLPQAQMPVVEAPELLDEDEPSIIGDLMDSERWDDEDCENSSEHDNGAVDISIRYNVYGTPLSPILEERESAVTSESLISKDDSRDVSIASKETAPSEDLLLVDTRTHKAVLLEATGEQLASAQEDDRDTSDGDISDDENLEYSTSDTLSSRRLENESHIVTGGSGAPLPSPEDELKWQQLPSSFPLPLPLPMQEGLISTSFVTENDWDSQDEEGEDEDEEEEEDEEENSSSSGEFVWKRYDEQAAEMKKIEDNDERISTNRTTERDGEVDVEEEAVDEDEEEEFTPSAWNATLAPHRSALRSPDKTQKSGDQKKSVWFKKQRYHCVYEYPKETPPTHSQGQTATTWEPTSYADWEEMMDEPRLDLYSLDYDEADHVGDEEFYVSSSSRPFQFQTGDGKYVSQFFPGATSALLQQCQEQEEEEEEEEEERKEQGDQQQQQNHRHHRHRHHCSHRDSQQQYQLGELRHTRDRLKLNLSSSNGTGTVLSSPAKQGKAGESSRVELLENRVPETTLLESQAVSVNATKERDDEEEDEESLAHNMELSDETVKRDNSVPSATTKLYPSDNQGNETCNILVTPIREDLH